MNVLSFFPVSLGSLKIVFKPPHSGHFIGFVGLVCFPTSGIYVELSMLSKKALRSWIAPSRACLSPDWSSSITAWHLSASSVNEFTSFYVIHHRNAIQIIYVGLL